MHMYCSVMILLVILIKLYAQQQYWSAQQVNISSDSNATFICSNFTPIIKMEEIVLQSK